MVNGAQLSNVHVSLVTRRESIRHERLAAIANAVGMNMHGGKFVRLVPLWTFTTNYTPLPLTGMLLPYTLASSQQPV